MAAFIVEAGVGIKVDPEKVEAISAWEEPTNASAVRSFLSWCTLAGSLAPVGKSRIQTNKMALNSASEAYPRGKWLGWALSDTVNPLKGTRGDILRKESGPEDFNEVKDDKWEERGAVVRAVRNPGPDILRTFGLAGRGNAGEQRGADVARGAEIGLHPRVPQAGVDSEKPIFEGISVIVPRRVPREKVLGRRGGARRGVVGRDGHPVALCVETG
ncbi:hypothetical protein E4U56_005990 [Claviceps arundinis]|uniref:Uncharacterized protein n=1 Tax=Claviceps arundinis TaxID=1623583 RepID=A0A9P7MLA3_9HYPO|nr:hypothetical protein E4U56_005990 [Claviceps arundinis]